MEAARPLEDLCGRPSELNVGADLFRRRADLRAEKKVVDRRENGHMAIILRSPAEWFLTIERSGRCQSPKP